MASPRTILLYSGWQVINIGDVGHTPGTLRYLQDHLPDARVHLWLRVTNPEVTAMLAARFPHVTIAEGNLEASGRASTPALQQAIDASDTFLYNSGMHFNRFWDPPVALVRGMRNVGKRVILYGQSFDGFREGREREYIETLSDVEAIYCRDVESMYFLRSAGVSAPVLEFGPDGCFGIDVRDDARAQSFLGAHSLEPRKYLCVILRTNTPKLGVRSGDMLNPYRPTPEQAAQDERWAERLREVITIFVRETGHKVLLAPEVDKEMIAARRLLLERLPEDVRAKVVHRETFWNVDEACSIYANAHSLVAMEPHSAIMALAAGTPVIHYCSAIHGSKRWMFRDIGLPEWLLDIDNDPTERCLHALRHIHQNYPLAQKKVARAMDFVNGRSGEIIRTLA